MLFQSADPISCMHTAGQSIRHVGGTTGWHNNSSCAKGTACIRSALPYALRCVRCAAATGACHMPDAPILRSCFACGHHKGSDARLNLATSAACGCGGERQCAAPERAPATCTLAQHKPTSTSAVARSHLCAMNMLSGLHRFAPTLPRALARVSRPIHTTTVARALNLREPLSHASMAAGCRGGVRQQPAVLQMNTGAHSASIEKAMFLKRS